MSRPAHSTTCSLTVLPLSRGRCERSPERRRRIGAALATSGLAAEALSNLAGENLDKSGDASVLFSNGAGEVQPLIDAIQDGPNLEVRLAGG